MSEQTALRRRYPLFLQAGLMLALALSVTAFSVPFHFGGDVAVLVTEDEAIRPVEIEVTEQRDEPPPPKPPAPVEVPDEKIELETVVDIDIPDVRTGPATIPLPPAPPAEPPVEPEEDVIFVVVENPPELIGGLEGLQSRIQYPEMARRAGIEGTVFVQFVVDENGNVVNPTCARDPGGNTCEEALRAVRDSKFKPGRQRGKPVKVRFSLPVKFRLR